MDENVEAQITTDWLTKALSQAEPGLEVHDATTCGRISGASTKVRVRIRTNRNTYPSSIIVKAGLEQHSDHMRPMHDNELHAYRDFIPTLDVNAPRCLYAGDDWAGNSLVVLEDLDERGVHFLSLQEPIGFDLARGFLDGLAKIHARWWDSPALDTPQFDWLKGTEEHDIQHYFDILNDPDRFGWYRNAPRGAAAPMMLHDAQRIRAAHKAMRDYHRDLPQTANHGDMHLGNLYTDADGTPGYLDWQPRRGPWAIDVSYFLVAGLDLVDRRRWEGALLQHYLEKLAELGIDVPSFDDAWDAYRKSIVWGLLIWLLNGVEFQTESRNTAASTRFCMAMVDHDVFGLLGV